MLRPLSPPFPMPSKFGKFPLWFIIQAHPSNRRILRSEIVAKVFKNVISGSFWLVFILDCHGFPYVNKNRGMVDYDP